MQGTGQDLLGTIGAGDEQQPAGEVVDLLDSIDEDDAEPWMPETKGEGVQGTVLKRSTVKSDFLEDILVPVVTIQDAAGKKIRVTGFQTVLRNEIEDANPQIGDLFAAKYFGEKDNRKGTGKYHHFKVAVQRGEASQASAARTPPPF